VDDKETELFFAQFFEKFLKNKEIIIKGYNESKNSEFEISFSESKLIFTGGLLNITIRDLLFNIV